jgi:hypothetical protein
VNRLQGFSAKSEKDLKKIGRGSMAEYTTDVDGVTITFVQWYDNKVVNLLSTYVGTEPRIKVMRWFSAQKARKEIDCPQIISIYNQHMGGVDLLDSLMGLYRITIRSKKWYHRLFFHFLDMAVVNAWLLYRRALSQQNNTSEVLRLAEFKAQIAEGLCKSNKGTNRKRAGRPSMESQLQSVAKKARRRHPVPVADVRTDDTSHWPTWTVNRLRCRLPGCSGQSHGVTVIYLCNCICPLRSGRMQYKTLKMVLC